MPIWLMLLLAGGTGYYYLSKATSTVEAPKKVPPLETSRVYQAPAETAKMIAPISSERTAVLPPAEAMPSGIGQRSIVDRNYLYTGG